ncbi:MAG: DUF6194 family protein [Chloroflexota bacterium]
MEPFDASRPSPASITSLITERYPGVVVGSAMSAWFFSLDESNWPNFATIVTTDEHDLAPVSDLARPGAFRVNIGVGKETFGRIAGWQADPDYAEPDTVVPHPVYAASAGSRSSTRPRPRSSGSSCRCSTRRTPGCSPSGRCAARPSPAKPTSEPA